MTVPEFSRSYRIDTIGSAKPAAIEAGPEERAALARRFDLQEISSLAAEAVLSRSGEEIRAVGTMSADVVQTCVATGEPIPARVEERFEILFRPPLEVASEEEIELGEGELDVVFYDGASIDLGEAVSETLSLALDPYPRCPGAEEALKEAGVKNEEEAGPFGALAALRDKLGNSEHGPS